jgi:hypothetical protein
MPNVLVRDLPAPVHARLAERAARAGLSLQQYLTDELTHLAARETVDEVLARVEGRRTGALGFGEAADALRRDRDRR